MNPDNKAAPVASGGEGMRAFTPASYPANPSNTTIRPDRPEWLAAKKSGDAGETLVADVLRAIGLAVTRITTPGTADLAISGRIEVKTDRRALTTGNVAIEVSFKGGPSGVMNESAGAWAYVIGENIYLISRVALLALVEQWRITERPCGEGARCVLIPLEELKAVAVVIDGKGGER